MTTTYEVTHSNGTRTTEHDTEDEARAEVTRDYGSDCCIHDEWQSCGCEGESEVERLLVWSSEEDADSDDGANAVASIRRWSR